MTGTLIAVSFLSILAGALGFALFAINRNEKPQDAKPKRKRHEEEFVTREEMDEAIAENSKQLEFEWNEWYEKFDKLHLRLSKRAKRAAQGGEQEVEQPSLDVGDRPSVLQFRRIGSV